MTLTNIIFLFSIMLIGGLVPGVSSLTVLSRSVSSGVRHGILTSLGIVIGDLVFIIIAIFGLSILAETMGALFELIIFCGGAYLIWIGTLLWQDELMSDSVEKARPSSLLSSFMTGFFITLGDLKALLFYIGFFPSLFDLSRITPIDTSIIIMVTILTLGSAKLCYVFMGSRAKLMIKNSNTMRRLNKATGAVLIVVGSYIMLTS